MTDPKRAGNLLAQLAHLNEQQLRRRLVEHLTKQKLGLYWEASDMGAPSFLALSMTIKMVGWISASRIHPTILMCGQGGRAA